MIRNKPPLAVAVAALPLLNFHPVAAQVAATSAATAGVSLPATGVTGLPIFPDSINVRDYGAKGDGVADDTRAIQLAVNAANTRASTWSRRVMHWDHLTRGASDSPFPEVVFPQGTYRITRPIVMGRYAALRGVGRVTIRQTDPTQDLLYFHANQRSLVENLHLDGGKIQMRVWTNNIGPATLAVADCTFSNSQDFAIECRSYTEKWVDLNVTKPWAPYEVAWAAGVPSLRPNSTERIQPWFNSTLATIARCRFDNVMRGVDMALDTGVIRDCQITTHPLMRGEFFRLGGKIHLDNVQALARMATPHPRFWIQNLQGSDGTIISVRRSTFDTDGTQGMALFHSQVPPVMSSIVLEATKIKAAGSPEGSVLWIRKGTQPNIVSIRDVAELSGRPVRAVSWEEVPDDATLEAIKDQPKGGNSKLMYKISVGPNGPSIDNTIPAIFQPLQNPPVPVEALRATNVDRPTWNYLDLQRSALENGSPLLAQEFGLENKPGVDNTAAVQRAVTAAGQSKRLLVFPAGDFSISQTIEIPAGIVMTASGTASISMDDRGRDLFSYSGSETIAAGNLTFNGGRNAFRVRTVAAKPVRIAFANCQFWDQAASAVEALGGNGGTAEPNLTEIALQGGVLAGHYGVVSNASRIYVAEAWGINDPHLDNAAFFQNLGGQFRLETLLTNPKLWQGKRSEGKVPETVQNWALSKDTRWVDNWGRLFSQDVRYGGECGGMCNVFNRSRSGTVFLDGGVSRFHNGVTRKAVLFLQEEPLHAVVTNVSTPPAQIEGSQSVMLQDGTSAVGAPRIYVRNVPTP